LKLITTSSLKMSIKLHKTYVRNARTCNGNIMDLHDKIKYVLLFPPAPNQFARRSKISARRTRIT